MRTASWENVDKQNNAAQDTKTHEHVSNDLKMWIKRLHTEIYIIITIYIHYKSIYFKIITCIILGLVNSNVFACKTNSAFNDFVDSCNWQAQPARGRALCKTGEFPNIFQSNNVLKPNLQD